MKYSVTFQHVYTRCNDQITIPGVSATWHIYLCWEPSKSSLLPFSNILLTSYPTVIPPTQLHPEEVHSIHVLFQNIRLRVVDPPLIPATCGDWENPRSRSAWVKSSKDRILMSKPGMDVHTCDPSCSGGINQYWLNQAKTQHYQTKWK
jgi:hypothetical protein